MIVGNAGNGTFIQSGGMVSANISGYLDAALAYGPGTVGSYYQSGGTNSVTATDLIVGEHGVGYYGLSGGLVASTETIVGYYTSGTMAQLEERTRY